MIAKKKESIAKRFGKLNHSIEHIQRHTISSTNKEDRWTIKLVKTTLKRYLSRIYERYEENITWHCTSIPLPLYSTYRHLEN